MKHTEETRKPGYWNDVIQIIATSPYLETGGPHNYNALIDKLNALDETPIDPAPSQPELVDKGWIKVNERLPEERMLHVLVFNGTAPEYNQHVFQAIWFRQRMNFKAEKDGYAYMGQITHWMPLPEPPKQCETSHPEHTESQVKIWNEVINIYSTAWYTDRDALPKLQEKFTISRKDTRPDERDELINSLFLALQQSTNFMSELMSMFAKDSRMSSLMREEIYNQLTANNPLIQKARGLKK